MNDSFDLVTISCPDCGPGFAPLEEIALRLNTENGVATMAFPCSVCGVRAALAISDHSTELLRQAGVTPVYWRFPDELRERPTESFPPLRRNDIRRLTDELEAELVALFPGDG